MPTPYEAFEQVGRVVDRGGVGCGFERPEPEIACDPKLMTTDERGATPPFSRDVEDRPWWWQRAYRRWRLRRKCFHHDPHTGMTFLSSQLIDCGMRKWWSCCKCGRQWFK